MDNSCATDLADFDGLALTDIGQGLISLGYGDMMAPDPLHDTGSRPAYALPSSEPERAAAPPSEPGSAGITPAASAANALTVAGASRHASIQSFEQPSTPPALLAPPTPSRVAEKFLFTPRSAETMPWVRVRQQAEGLSLSERLARMRGEAPAQPSGPSLPAVNETVRVSREDAERDYLLQETAKHLRSIGRVNILVAGQTGVGKSTLINSVFGEHFAQTAAGRPVTQHAEWYSSPTMPLRILDTKGLEAKDYERTLRGVRAEIEKGRNATDTKDQLHIGWVCISTPSSRVQDCEVDIVRMLNRFDIPAIVVLTKDDDDPNFADVVACIMAEQRAYCKAIVPVRALARRSIPAQGLESLVMATYRALPDAHRSAFAAAQKINRDLNKKAAEDYVNAAAIAAAASAVIPIPLVDLATLAPIQAGMMLGISSAFGLSLNRGQIRQVITTTLGSLAASFAGKWAVGNVLKFIPGAGTAVGAALNATVAGAVTRGMGTAFIRFLYKFMESNNRAPSADEILDVFPKYYKTGEA